MPRIQWSDMRFKIAKIQRNISHYREHRLGITQAELARDVPEELKAPYSEALRLFATEPGIKGCMTKMILGYRLHEEANRRGEAAAEGGLRVRGADGGVGRVYMRKSCKESLRLVQPA